MRAARVSNLLTSWSEAVPRVGEIKKKDRHGAEALYASIETKSDSLDFYLSVEMHRRSILVMRVALLDTNQRLEAVQSVDDETVSEFSADESLISQKDGTDHIGETL